MLLSNDHRLVTFDSKLRVAVAPIDGNVVPVNVDPFDTVVVNVLITRITIKKKSACLTKNTCQR